MNPTDYYNQNAQSFFDRTINADLRHAYANFFHISLQKHTFLMQAVAQVVIACILWRRDLIS
jgi:hypothetical protein